MTPAGAQYLKVITDIVTCCIHKPCNSKASRFDRVAPCARSKSCHVTLLGCCAAAGNVCGMDRTNSILSSEKHCCSQSLCRQHVACHLCLHQLLGGSGWVVNSPDFCLASLKSLGCFYFWCRTFFTMEGGDSEFANFTLPTLKAFFGGQ